MVLIGAFALALALGSALLTMVAGFAGGRTRVRRYAVVSENGLYAIAAFMGIASAALLWSFVQHDFSLKYVEGRSDTRMPLYYVLAAFYGGQEGSLLFWVFISSTFAAAAAWANRFRLSSIMPYFHGVVALGLTGFLLILNFVTTPFATYFIKNPPIEGQGLNPLLQTPLMTIHPPMLLAGFATAIVPFAFGMAALLARQTDTRWLQATRRWTLASWLILGVGNILGGMWAYRELGWGGYWAWDAVENAALVPWLVATAFVHSVIIQERRGMLKRWNVLLVTLYYVLTLVGTWMTRSGLIDSVHTFAESDIGVYFLAQVILMGGFSAYVIATRWKDLAPAEDMENALSREGMFVFNNWIFLAMAAVVMYGTLFPAVAEVLVNETISYGAPWFNRVLTPIALLMLVVMALGTVMPWRHATRRTLRTQILPPVLMTAVIAPTLVAAYWLGRGRNLKVDIVNVPGFLAIFTFVLIVLNASILFLEFYRGAKTRMHRESSVVQAVLSLFRTRRRRYGGYLAHIGVLMIFLSFLGNVLKVERDITMQPGMQVPVADYEMRYDGIKNVTRRDYVAYIGEMTLLRDGKEIAKLHPARYDYNDYTRVERGQGDPLKVTSEIYIRSNLLEDVYVALLSFDADRSAAAFHLEVFPFTVWMWLGGLMLIFGTAVAAWPVPDPLREAWRKDVARRSATFVGAAGLLLICLVPVGVLMDTTFSIARAQESEGVVHEVRSDAPERQLPSELGNFLNEDIELTPTQERTAKDAFSMVMTECEGCAGKTLSLASPSCVPSNVTKQEIRMMAAAGMNRDQILERIEKDHGHDAMAIPQVAIMRVLNWLLPVTVLVGGLLLAMYVVSVRRKRGAGELSTSGSYDHEASLDPEDASDAPYLAQLDRELQEGDA